jgi:hypothetical protein
VNRLRSSIVGVGDGEGGGPELVQGRALDG